MDVRRHDWIIWCAYLVWFVIGAVTAGRVFDVMNPVVTQILADAGQNLTLECPGVTEYLMVSRLEWRSNEVRIVEYGSQSTTLFVHHGRVSLMDKKFALFFNPVKSEDSGEYQCLVNSRNVPEVIVNLTVQDVPDPPGRPIATNFTSRSITISWAPSENSHNNPISHYIINVRVGENGPWDKNMDVVTPNNDTKYYMENLKPFTSYSFRVLAVNARGSSEPSVVSHYITTLREVPIGKPTITAAYNTSATSIFITWKPPSLDTLNGEFLGYRVAYKPRDMGPEHIKEIYIRNRKIERHTIQKLATFTQYSVQLAVFNPEGTGPNASVIVMTDEGGE